MERISDHALDVILDVETASAEHEENWLVVKALQELKERRADQQKYEKALVEMTKYFRCNKLKGLYSSEEDCHEYKSCAECMVKFFKKQVGLEVEQ